MASTTITNYEKGRHSPRGPALIRLIEALQINKEWLLTGNGLMEPEPVIQAAEPQATYGGRQAGYFIPGKETQLIELVEAVAAIYRSGNKVVLDALLGNLQAFLLAIQAKERPPGR